MPPASAPSPSDARRTPAGLGGGGEMCSGAWKRGPQIAIGVISLWVPDVQIIIINRPKRFLDVLSYQHKIHMLRMGLCILVVIGGAIIQD